MIYAHRDFICCERREAIHKPNSLAPFQKASPASHNLFFLGPSHFNPADGLLPSATVTISSSKPYDSAIIPLRTLASSSQPRGEDSAALLKDKKGNRHSSDSAGSDFSLWSDTGDLAEQLADDEDPLRIRLRESVEDQGLSRSNLSPLHRRPKHVHYLHHIHLEQTTTNPGLSKEAIEIPNPPARQIGRTEKALAIIMTGDRQKSQMQGLTGKPLLYVLWSASSLGIDVDVPQVLH